MKFNLNFMLFFTFNYVNNCNDFLLTRVPNLIRTILIAEKRQENILDESITFIE